MRFTWWYRPSVSVTCALRGPVGCSSAGAHGAPSSTMLRPSANAATAEAGRSDASSTS